VDTSDTIVELEALTQGGTSPAAKVEKASAVVVDEPKAPTEQAPAIEINEELLVEIAADDRLTGSIEDVEPAQVETAAIEVNEDLLAEIAADDRLTGSIEKVVTEKVENPKEETVVKRGVGKPDERREKEDRRKEPRRVIEKPEATIRVETGKLDQTMNLVGELVLARNSLMRLLNLPEMKGVLEKAPYINEVMTNIEHLSQVTKDLQLSVLSTRMQPIKKVFDKIPRQVRDLKTKLGREVDVVIEGEMTEVDKSLVEELSDPMVHLIRNSLDHGIELPQDREAVGKNPTGTIKVSAFYEGNKVVIQVKDDGAGIDPEKIRNLAVKKGIIDDKAAELLSDEDAVKLIMAAGFSTAETVSDVSGRGVGMDVVNSSIQAVKGTVDIVSEFGVGTTISIYLPLTLAIVQALVVKSSNEGFAIPIGDINEVIKYNPVDVHKMNDRDVIELRGAVLPLYYLHELTLHKKPSYRAEKQEIKGHIQKTIVEDLPGEKTLKGQKDNVENCTDVAVVEEKEAKVQQEQENNSSGYVVVVSEGRQALGLVVEQLVGQEEAVIKALGSNFEYHSAISGATITGDGTVHMILDVPYLIKEISKK
jgi:two-component system chemotaxis sensor kinase CheA